NDGVRVFRGGRGCNFHRGGGGRRFDSRRRRRDVSRGRWRRRHLRLGGCGSRRSFRLHWCSGGFRSCCGEIHDAAVELGRVGPVGGQVVGHDLLQARAEIIGVLSVLLEQLVAFAAAALEIVGGDRVVLGLVDGGPGAISITST